MKDKKLYIVRDIIKDGDLVGLCDNKENVLINIYKYLKKEHVGSGTEWSDFIGKISDFSIRCTYVNKCMTDVPPDFTIGGEEFRQYMLLSPREHSLKKLLDIN